jgi:tetratricopeptide (TPR) repeat protein
MLLESGAKPGPPMKLLVLVLLLETRVLIAECSPSEMTANQARARFQQLDKKAQIEFRREQFAEASKDFDQAACMAPESLRPHYELYAAANAAASTHDLTRTRELLERADELQPGYALPLAMLVKINLISGDIGNVKRSLRVAARRFPLDGRLHADLAQDLLHVKQYDLALAEALRVEDNGALDGRANVNLAVLENQLGAFRDAARLASAVEEQSGLPEKVRASGAAIAGLSYESLGQAREAVQHLSLAIRLDPHQEQPYLALARIYAQRQDPGGALRVLNQRRTLAGESPDVLLALGDSLLALEHYQEGIQILTGLIQNSPNQLEAYPKLAAAYRNAGDPQRATETLRQLARRKPDDLALHVVIAQSLLDEEQVDYPGVLEELAIAGDALPEDYDVHYLRGKVFLATGRYEDAVTSLRRAVELRPTEPGAYYQLGMAYRKAGQPDLAREQFEKLEFLKGPPGSPKGRD